LAQTEAWLEEVDGVQTILGLPVRTALNVWVNGEGWPVGYAAEDGGMSLGVMDAYRGPGLYTITGPTKGKFSDEVPWGTGAKVFFQGEVP
jgi:hypothetical protein